MKEYTVWVRETLVKEVTIQADTLAKVWRASYAEIKRLPEKWELELTDLKDSLK